MSMKNLMETDRQELISKVLEELKNFAATYFETDELPQRIFELWNNM